MKYITQSIRAVLFMKKKARIKEMKKYSERIDSFVRTFKENLYSIYEQGLVDGKKHNQDELNKEKQYGYDVGYKKGYEDGRHISEKFGYLEEKNLRESYNKGMDDAWKLYRKLYSEIPQTDVAEMFDGNTSIQQIIKLYSPQAISKIIESYEKRNAFEVGMEVVNTNNGTKAVIIKINGDTAKVYEQGIGFNNPPLSALKPLEH